MISRTLSLQAPQGGAQFLWSQICPGAKNRSNGTPQKQVMQLQGIFHVHPLRQLVERQSHNDRLSQIKTCGKQSLAGRSSWKMLRNVYGIACIIKYPCTWHLRHLNCKSSVMYRACKSQLGKAWKSMEKQWVLADQNLLVMASKICEYGQQGVPVHNMKSHDGKQFIILWYYLLAQLWSTFRCCSMFLGYLAHAMDSCKCMHDACKIISELSWK